MTKCRKHLDPFSWCVFLWIPFSSCKPSVDAHESYDDAECDTSGKQRRERKSRFSKWTIFSRGKWRIGSGSSRRRREERRTRGRLGTQDIRRKKAAWKEGRRMCRIRYHLLSHHEIWRQIMVILFGIKMIEVMLRGWRGTGRWRCQETMMHRKNGVSIQEYVVDIVSCSFFLRWRFLEGNDFTTISFPGRRKRRWKNLWSKEWMMLRQIMMMLKFFLKIMVLNGVRDTTRKCVMIPFIFKVIHVCM